MGIYLDFRIFFSGLSGLMSHTSPVRLFMKLIYELYSFYLPVVCWTMNHRPHLRHRHRPWPWSWLWPDSSRPRSAAVRCWRCRCCRRSGPRNRRSRSRWTWRRRHRPAEVNRRTRHDLRHQYNTFPIPVCSHWNCCTGPAENKRITGGWVTYFFNKKKKK